MKKLLVVVFCALFFNLSVNAQSKYKDIKGIYNPKDYVRRSGDMYNVAVAGIASFLIPGLGQMVSGEGGRGIAFLGGFAGLYTIALVTAPKVDEFGNVTKEGNSGLATIAILGAVGVAIASIVDAVKVAKVKNLAYKRSSSSKVKLQLNPYLGTLNSIEGVKPTAGLNLAIKF